MALVVKNPPAKAGDVRDRALIPVTRGPPREGNGNQCSSLGNPTDRGTWRAIAHGVARESDTTLRLNNDNKYIYKYIYKICMYAYVCVYIYIYIYI